MSRLAEMQARFQQKQMQEKEEKLLRLYENQQQRAFDKVSRGSSGSSGGSSPVGVTSSGPGRVRQMFDERRQKAGIDRSYPLEPLKQTTRLNGHATTTRVSNTITKSPSRQTTRASIQNSLSQSFTTKTRTAKHTSNAAYTNGNHRNETTRYDESNDLENDNPLQMMQQQQKQLEMMMNNHNLDENIEDEELIDVGIDELDESRENSPGPDVIWTNTKNNRNSEVFSGESTPTKKIPPARPAPKAAPARKLLSKANSITKPAAPKSTAVQKATKPAAPSVSSKQPPSSIRTSASSPQKSARSALSSVVKDDLQACRYCDRRFAVDRVVKHEQICSQTLKKKRKTYDATKHRVQGTEAEAYCRKVPTKAASMKSKSIQPPKSDWKRQHEEFIGAIRAAKMAQAHVAAGGKLSDLPPPPPSLNPDYVQCPHCGRRFNAAAAERHIPKCATMLHNKPNRMGPPRK